MTTEEREIRNRYKREHARKQREKGIKRSPESIENHRRYCRDRFKKKQHFLDLLKFERGCVCYDCGGVFETNALEWDHLPGTDKKFTITAAKVPSSFDGLAEEISKCQLVCAVCHRNRTRTRKEAV